MPWEVVVPDADLLQEVREARRRCEARQRRRGDPSLPPSEAPTERVNLRAAEEESTELCRRPLLQAR